MESGPLRLTFDKSLGDRWQHSIDVRIGGDWRLLLASVEGTADETDPPSPAFQDLRLEIIDPQTAEFQLFGQAGRRVYSSAVRFDGSRGEIDFDVCCRLPSQLIGVPVISSYICPSGCSEVSATEESEPTRLHLPPHPLEIELPALPNQKSAGWRFTAETSPPVVQLGCFDVASPAAPTSMLTIRWRYVIRLRLP